MIQAYLDNIKEDAARILREYTNKRVQSSFTGGITYTKVFNESKRCHYLARVIDYLYLVGEIPYLGGTATTDAYVKSVMDSIWHYSGTYDGVELDSSNFSTIVPDDGDGGACEGDSGSQTEDHYRSGNLAVTTGANPVTFIKDGVASPLESADYTVEAWVISESGQRQNNIVVTGQVAGGFTASDVLKAGTLYYIATLNT